MMKKFVLKSLAAVAMSVGLAGPALAAGDAPVPPAQNWSFNGPFGTYDRAALQRGFQVYSEVCAACHGLNYIAFRNLAEPGGPEFTEAEMKAIADSRTIMDIDDDGEEIERNGKPADKWPAPFPNKKAAAAANGGKAPPDLSLMAKARMNGPDYIYALLTHYRDEAPEGSDTDVPAGLYYNDYFPDHIIAMAPPLFDDMVEYQDGTPATVDQMASDVTQFLMWTAEPKMEHRKSLGVRVMLFLIIFAGLLYAVKRKVWADAH